MKSPDYYQLHAGFKIEESAFAGYYFIKKRKYAEALQLIEALKAKIDSGLINCTNIALWLWVVGEFIKESGDIALGEKYNGSISSCIDRINSGWCVPSTNWTGIGEEEIFLSNISIIYGGLFSINNAVKQGTIQKLLIDIRKFVFDKFIKDGKLVSRLGSKDIFGDITIAAMPFGMFGIEDRILVEALAVTEQELITKGVRFSKEDKYYGGCIRIDLTCFMAWYYSEKGEMGKARAMLEYVEAVWKKHGKLYEIDTDSCKEQLYYNYWQEKQRELEESYLCYILYELANINIEQKLGSGSSEISSDIKIIHRPSGYDDPYYFENNERCPRYPEAGDTVYIKAVTQRFSASQEVWIEYAVNGKPGLKIQMSLEAAKDGEKYWQSDLGYFNENDVVEYFIIVKSDDYKIVSCKYNFHVRQWQSIGRLISVKCEENDGNDGIDGNEISLIFNSLKECGKYLYLKIVKVNERTIKWSMRIENSSADLVMELCEGERQGDKDIIGRVDELESTFYKLLISLAGEEVDIELLDKVKKTEMLKGFNSCGSHLFELLTDDTGMVYKVRMNFKTEAAERFFGMGERYSRLEYRGFEVDNYVYNQYRDQGLKAYIPVPFYISSNGYGMYLDTAEYSTFRFASRLDDLVEIEANLGGSCSLDFYMFTGEPKAIITELSSITGTPKLPPKWSFGLWMSSNNWDSQAETLKQVELTNKYEIPATALVLEQWSDEATFYIFNDAVYDVKQGNDYLRYEDFSFPDWGRWPDPKKMVASLHDEGLKVLLWQVSVEKYMNGIAHAQRDEDERAMLENGYHVKHEDGSEYRIPYNWFSGSLIPDFTNPDAVKWWLDKRLYLLKDVGIDGFKTDGGECVFGTDLVFHDGSQGDVMRNRYPLDYIGSFYDFVQEHVPGGGITFSRSGYTGAQNMPLHWAGDERSTWEAFRASVIAGLSCGMSGIPFWGWDLAGFHGEIPTAELYLRATEMAVFCPVMQYHAETKGEFNQDRTPWNIAERTGKPYVLDIFKRFADLRMNLLPYIYQQAVLSCKTGVPMMRAMFVEFPDDASCYGLTQQYMFGETLLVAPVMEEGSYKKSVYLPEGRWMNFFTGNEVKGRSFSQVVAAIDEIPAYVKEDSIIPLNLADTLNLGGYVSNKVDAYKNLCFLMYLAGSCRYSFKDDTGNSAEIEADRNSDLISISVQSNYCPVTVILGGIKDTAGIKVESKNITAANGTVDAVECTYKECEMGMAMKICFKSENDRVNISINVSKL